MTIPCGTAKYDKAYLEKYDVYERTDLGLRLNASRWETVERYVPRNGTILDWGCGNGAFIRSAPLEYSVFGYDINPNSQFKSLAMYGQGTSALTLFDVVEHMEYPRQFLAGAKAKHVIICTPDVGDALPDIEKWKHFRPDEHQHYFSVESLVRLLGVCGYRVVEMHRDEARIRDPHHPYALMTVVGERHA